MVDRGWPVLTLDQAGRSAEAARERAGFERLKALVDAAPDQ
jgi:hypothetical protein